MEKSRNRLIDILEQYFANYKSNEINDLMKNYGIFADETLNPYNSKRRYARSGLEKLSKDELVEKSKQIAIKEENTALNQQLEGIVGDEIFEFKYILRRKLVDCFDKCPNLEGNLKLDELLDGIWNMNEVYCENGDVFTFERLTVGEYIIQHVKEEKDMSYKSMLLDMLKFKYVSDSIVIKFIEKIVNPEVRTGEEQILYVNKINEIISTDGFELAISKRVSGELFYKIYKKHTRKGIMKNLIFAPLGSKPDIVIDDAIDNDLRLIGDFDNCLMYDFESDDNGLTWNKLVKWWGNKTRSENVQKDLYKRLISSLDSKPEKIFFQHYYMIFKDKEKYPALIPQVFLHYDPYAKNWRGNSVIYTHQRMDFLMLLPNGVRIVFEIDGKQHYSNGDTSSPCLYAEMVSDTRKLQLQGYEVYRFGGYEFVDINSAKQMIREFFEKLFKKYIIF